MEEPQTVMRETPEKVNVADQSKRLFSRRFLTRSDLQFVRVDQHSANSGSCWNVFDPLKRQSYRVGDAERWLLKRFDGTATLRQIFHEFSQEFPFTLQNQVEWLRLVATFESQHLIRDSQCKINSPGSKDGGEWNNIGTPQNGSQLTSRSGFAESSANRQNQDAEKFGNPIIGCHSSNTSKGVLARVHSWLASCVVWQVRGVNPDRWLAHLGRHSDWIFSGTAVRYWLILFLVTVIFVLFDFARFFSHAWDLDWLSRPAAGGLLLIVFAVTRGLHELGHGIACKRFGVRCPDMGIFFILGAPCVYCDVSESWRLPARWQRAAISAAGIYVELIVASLAAWCWLLTMEGPINTLALQVMIICSVSTAFINANPLMRFDGYYILCDWLDETNLRRQANQLGQTYLQRFVLGDSHVRNSSKQPPPSGKRPPGHTTGQISKRNLTRRERGLLLFCLASWCYRLLLSIGIASILIAMYAKWNLLWFGRLLALAILISWWGIPAMKLLRNLYREAAQLGRRWRLLLVSASFILLIGFIPLPNRRSAIGWLQPEILHSVYAPTTGQLVSYMAETGETVEKDQPLFELRDDELRLSLIRRLDRLRQLDLKLADMQRLRDLYEEPIDLLPIESEKEAAADQVSRIRKRCDALTVRAKKSGKLIVMTAEPIARPASEGPWGKLTSVQSASTPWTNPRQLGRQLVAGTLLAAVVGSKFEAIVPLSDHHLADVVVGTPVRISFHTVKPQVVHAAVHDIVPLHRVHSPWARDLTSNLADGLASPQSTSLPSPVAGSSTGEFRSAGGHKPPLKNGLADLPASSNPGFAAIISLPPPNGTQQDAASGWNVPAGADVQVVFRPPPKTVWQHTRRWLQANLRLLAD